MDNQHDEHGQHDANALAGVTSVKPSPAIRENAAEELHTPDPQLTAFRHVLDVCERLGVSPIAINPGSAQVQPWTALERIAALTDSALITHRGTIERLAHMEFGEVLVDGVYLTSCRDAVS